MQSDYPRERRQSQYKLSQELKWKIARFRADYTHAKSASRKRETLSNWAKNLSTIYAWIGGWKQNQKLFLIKDIYCWLPPGLDGWKVCSSSRGRLWWGEKGAGVLTLSHVRTEWPASKDVPETKQRIILSNSASTDKTTISKRSASAEISDRIELHWK